MSAKLANIGFPFIHPSLSDFNVSQFPRTIATGTSTAPPPLTNNNKTANATATLPNEERTYQNNDFVRKALSGKMPAVASPTPADATKFHTMKQAKPNDRLGNSSQFSTLPPASRKGIVDVETGNLNDNSGSLDEAAHSSSGPDHDYYNDVYVSLSTDDNPSKVGASKPARPIPERLKLSEMASAGHDTPEPSPALSTASGPYIPISECFSGSPVLTAMIHRNGGGGFFGGAQMYEGSVSAPMNLLSRSQFDIPKSPLHIGHLNLTEEGGTTTQSPKRRNSAATTNASGGGARSSDDSESVFTDDEMASSHSGSHAGSAAAAGELQLRRTAGGTLDRRLRPSDSSIENENIGWTAMQRYSKVPFEEKKCLNSSDPPPRPPKPATEGSAEAVGGAVMGPLDSNSCVTEERYEIPRSHRHPYNNNNNSTLDNSPTSADLVASSTPYILSNGEETPAPPVEPKLYNRSHFYTNAAPTTLEGHFFRYDFVENAEYGGGGGGGGANNTSGGGVAPPPAVNRNLKPKTASLHVPSKSCDQIETPPPLTGNSSISYGSFDASMNLNRSTTLNRLVKPHNSSSGFGRSTAEHSHDESNRSSVISRANTNSNSLQKTPSRSDDKLQYLDLDLDHTSAGTAAVVAPTRPESIRKLSSVSAHNIHAVAGHTAGLPSLATIKHSISEHDALGGGAGQHGGASATNGFLGSASSTATLSSVVGGGGNAAASSGRGIVYKTVDFVKTDAFNRTRQDAEMSRASNKDK